MHCGALQCIWGGFPKNGPASVFLIKFVLIVSVGPNKVLCTLKKNWRRVFPYSGFVWSNVWLTLHLNIYGGSSRWGGEQVSSKKELSDIKVLPLIYSCLPPNIKNSPSYNKSKNFATQTLKTVSSVVQYLSASSFKRLLIFVRYPEYPKRRSY